MFNKKNIHKIIIDDQKNLTLTGLSQFIKEVTEEQKIKTLLAYLKKINFNQVIIFVKKVQRAKNLNKLLNECDFKSLTLHRKMSHNSKITI